MEDNKVKGYPLFEGRGSDRELVDDEHSTTGDGHPGRRGSTTGDGHPARINNASSTTGDGHPDREYSTTGDGHPDRNTSGKKESILDKVVDKLTGEDHSTRS